jgi:Uma2 family endonuclease
MAVQVEDLLRPLTYDDLEAYDDDRYRYEIIFGELVVSPSASPSHAQIVARLSLAFGNANDKRNLGEVWTSPVDVELPLNNVVVPDLIFISHETIRIAKNHVVVAPELAIEVVSPSSRRRDYITKRLLYENAGIKEYWIVDPVKKVVEVLALVDGRYVQTENEGGFARSAVVPGVEIKVSRLFENLLA